jgi:hypothetical protein
MAYAKSSAYPPGICIDFMQSDQVIYCRDVVSIERMT